MPPTKKRKNVDFEKGVQFFEELKKREDAKKAATAAAAVPRRRVVVKRVTTRKPVAAAAASKNHRATNSEDSGNESSSSSSSSVASSTLRSTPRRRQRGSAPAEISSHRTTPNRKKSLAPNASRQSLGSSAGRKASPRTTAAAIKKLRATLQVLKESSSKEEGMEMYAHEKFEGEVGEEEEDVKPRANKRPRIESPPHTRRVNTSATTTTTTADSLVVGPQDRPSLNTTNTDKAIAEVPVVVASSQQPTRPTSDPSRLASPTTRSAQQRAERERAAYEAARQWASTSGLTPQHHHTTPPRSSSNNHGNRAAFSSSSNEPAPMARLSSSSYATIEKPPFGSPLPTTSKLTSAQRRASVARSPLVATLAQPQPEEESEDDDDETANVTTDYAAAVDHVPEPEVTEEANSKERLAPRSVGCRFAWAVFFLASQIGLGLLLAAAMMGDTSTVVLHNIIASATSAIKHQPCFEDYPVRNINDYNWDEDDLVTVASPPHCEGILNRTPCPLGGHCAGGRLQRCYDPLYEETEFTCVLTETARGHIAALVDLLETYSTQEMFAHQKAKNPFYVHRHAETDRPLFLYQSLVDVLQLPYDPKLVRAANVEADTFLFEIIDNGNVFIIGLHPSKPIPLSAWCYAKNLVHSAITGVLVLFWTIAVVVGSWIVSYFVESPVEAVVVTVVGFTVLSTMRYVSTKRRRQQQLLLEVIQLRERVYEELSKDACKPVVANLICNRIAWKDHPASRQARDRVSRVLWPMVVRDLETDSRVHHSWTSAVEGSGQHELVWQWMDRPHFSIVRFRDDPAQGE